MALNVLPNLIRTVPALTAPAVKKNDSPAGQKSTRLSGVTKH
jgi:hypothetical protein